MESEGKDTIPTPRRSYWQAQALVELEQINFDEAIAAGDLPAQRRAFYTLAGYYGRTLSILRTALKNSKEPLAVAAMQNLATLHRPLARMHAQAPETVPLALTLDRQGRDDFVNDLVVRVLAESPGAQSAEAVRERVNHLDLMGDVRKGTVERHLKNLVDSGHAQRVDVGFNRTHRTYTELDLDALSLRALAGQTLYEDFVAAGFVNLYEVDARPSVFCARFVESTGLSADAGREFVSLCSTLLETVSQEAGAWQHFDLLGSPYPRPYQYEAFSVFRGNGYQAQVVEAPTGSGKTLIGQMCIQDWLRTLSPGQSILVLVPTKNYQQQWIGEMCYNDIGLQLSPELVFSGTPAQLESFTKRTGQHPAILLLTYTSLAQTGSGVGKGGFDTDSVEMFLQLANVQYVALDEVHKVAEDLRSVSADVTRLLVEWLEDTSVRGLVGFSGTAEAYRKRFARLGLKLAHGIPLEDLIAYGFVAPFAELGVPFSYSSRERQVRHLLDEYKDLLHDFVMLLGSDVLRSRFAALPMDERVQIASTFLAMYRGRKNQNDALAARFAEWERGSGDLNMNEIKLVTILQIAKGWSDRAMAEALTVDADDFARIHQRLSTIRDELADLIYSPDTLAQLRHEGLGTAFDAERLAALPEATRYYTQLLAQTKEVLAVTAVGLYSDLTAWYRRVGEGRVETIKAVIEAERAVRPLSGIIVFDNARRILWKQGAAAPGYEGVGGLFAQMLGDERFTPFAVLSNEMYMAYGEENPLPPRIATFVENRLLRGEIADAIFGMTTQGTGLDDSTLAQLRKLFAQQIDDYIPRLLHVHAERPGEFSRRVLNPLRRLVRKLDLGRDGERILMRLDRRNVHLAGLVETFFDYALIARYFREAKVGELEQVSGARQHFFVVPMPSGSRKQLMYDLTSRIVDDEDLDVNLVIVSNWARTGWNVIVPNLLIDATATRDVTAWQQLRGRAIRSLRSWSNDCYRLIMLLNQGRALGFDDLDALPEDVARAFDQVTGDQPRERKLDDSLREILRPITTRAQRKRLAEDGIDALTDEERYALSMALMQHRNKVTHIYELVKAYGSTSQVTYDRGERRWRRRDHIARKHANEISVQPFTGELLAGVGHAPMVYAEDPRLDTPEALEASIKESIKGSDDIIVSGWMR